MADDEFGKKIGLIVRDRKERDERGKQQQAETEAAIRKFQQGWQQETSPKVMQWLNEIQQALAAQAVQARVQGGGAGACAIHILPRSSGGQGAAALQIIPNIGAREVRIDRQGHWRNLTPDQITKSMLETEVLTLVQEIYE